MCVYIYIYNIGENFWLALLSQMACPQPYVAAKEAQTGVESPYIDAGCGMPVC